MCHISRARTLELPTPGFLLALRALGAKLISDEQEGLPGGAPVS